MTNPQLFQPVDARTQLDVELAAELEALRQRALHRRLRTLSARQSGRMEVDGRECLLLAGSNYLDLAADARVLGLAISHTTRVHPQADQRNLELLLARPPVPLTFVALLTSAGSA